MARSREEYELLWGKMHVDSRCAEHSPVINNLLIYACLVFGAASFIFGFDDKIISPVMGLAPFVSFQLSAIMRLANYPGPTGTYDHPTRHAQTGVLACGCFG